MSCISDVPPPLPPRPTHIFPPSETRQRNTEPSRHVDICEKLSPVMKQGYHLMRPSKSVQELNNLSDNNNNNIEHTSCTKSLTRTREGSYSSRSFKLFGKKKPAAV